VLVFVAVVLTQAGDWYYVPGVFVSFAAVVFWWFATGLDGWAQHGGGVGNSVSALGKPETAGFGAFGGVLSTPVEWVYISSLASLICGSLLGVASVKLSTAKGSGPGRSQAWKWPTPDTTTAVHGPAPFRIRGTARGVARSPIATSSGDKVGFPRETWPWIPSDRQRRSVGATDGAGERSALVTHAIDELVPR